MSTNVIPISADGGEPTVRLENKELIFDDFRERDVHVIALAEDAENLEGLMHDCLAVGARAMTAAQATTDVAVVEKAFGEMTNTFALGLKGFADELDAKTKELLDEDGGVLPRSLEEFKSEMEQLLDGTFDPESKVSALAKFEEVMRKAATEQVKAIRGLIDPDNDASPLGRYRNDIVKTVEKETGKLHKVVEELKTQLAVNEAKAEMFEFTAKKGFTFEDKLEYALVGICEPHGDVAERCGGTVAARGKKGDFVVSVNPDDVGGRDASYVLEAKDRVYRLREILQELDKAIDNRGAVAGIAVFAKDEQCPGGSPFQTYGNKALVVYDKGDENDLALRLACCWARWVVRRQLAADGDSIDLARVQALIEAARQGLGTASKIRTALNGSKTQIDRALGHIASLVAEVEAALGGLEEEVAA